MEKKASENVNRYYQDGVIYVRKTKMELGGREEVCLIHVSFNTFLHELLNSAMPGPYPFLIMPTR